MLRSCGCPTFPPAGRRDRTTRTTPAARRPRRWRRIHTRSRTASTPPAGDGADQHEAVVLASKEAAAAALDALVAQETLDCYAREGKSVRSQVSAGTTIGPVTVARLNVLPSGDRAAASASRIP